MASQTTAHGRQDQFIHLARLAWDLRGLGVATSLTVRPEEQPFLEVLYREGQPFRVEAIHRPHGWMFSWRPLWSRLWRRSEWAWALDEDAATKIKVAVTE